MKSCRALVGLLSSTCLAAGLVTRAPASPGNDTGVVIRNQNANQTVPNRYLVAFKRGLSDDVVNAKEAEINATISKGNVNKRSLDSRQLSLESFPFSIDDETRGIILDADDATIQALARSEQVDFIEANVVGSRDGIVSQQNATANLVRLSHNKVDGFSSYDYDDAAGQGITVYVLDVGIRLTHDEFEGRATFGASFSAHAGEGDLDGHGTHVAGIVGGATYGVAKKVQLVSVKLDGRADQMIKALDFVLEHVKKNKREGKAVINMSMHVDGSEIIDRKFKHVVDSGVVCVVSAGNDNDDAGKYSPGRDPSVITVGASHHDGDFRWAKSNHGAAVDIYGAGVGIKSASHGSDSDWAERNGTSQGAPQVAGLAAYIMALEGITQPGQVASRLKALAEQSGARVHYNVPNTTNLIASNGVGPPLDPNAVPKKIPWMDGTRTWTCGHSFEGYEEETCGTQVFCDVFDSQPEERKQGYFETSQKCFDAHEPAPKRPWIEAPPQEVRAESCETVETSDECPYFCGYRETYSLLACGTQAFCEAFNLNPRPPTLIGYKDAKACLDRYEPQTNSTKSSEPPTATSGAPVVNTDGPARNRADDGPVRNKADDGPARNRADDGPARNRADDGPARNRADDGPVRNKADDGPVRNKADDGPARNKANDGPARNRADDGPVRNKADDGPVRNKADDGPARNKADDGPARNRADDGPARNRADDGPVRNKADDGPARNRANDGPAWNRANDGPARNKTDDGPAWNTADDGPSYKKGPEQAVSAK